VVADKVRALCDGNMLATAIMGKALGKRDPDTWQHVLAKVQEDLNDCSNRDIPQEYHNRHTVKGAIEVAAKSLTPAAEKAFDMLRLLQVQRQLPLSLLKSLWKAVYAGSPDLADEDVTVPLTELVEASLLCKVSKQVWAIRRNRTGRVRF
jgi:hypothetical protein